jgi:integrase
MKKSQDNVESLLDFVDQNSHAKSDIQKCIKYLTREVNKQKLNYGQLRYIFRAVRENCQIEVTKDKKSLYELPQADDLKAFYSQIKNPIHKLIFPFLQSTGLRVSELCKLEIKHY